MTVEELINLKFHTDGAPKVKRIIVNDDPMAHMTFVEDGLKLYHLPNDGNPAYRLYGDEKVKMLNEHTYEIKSETHMQTLIVIIM